MFFVEAKKEHFLVDVVFLSLSCVLFFKPQEMAINKTMCPGSRRPPRYCTAAAAAAAGGHIACVDARGCIGTFCWRVM